MSEKEISVGYLIRFDNETIEFVHDLFQVAHSGIDTLGKNPGIISVERIEYKVTEHSRLQDY
jgi:hypothetical protein